jgi:hypothetical protein
MESETEGSAKNRERLPHDSGGRPARLRADANGGTSIRRVADDVGVGRSTLHKFILGRTAPQPRVRRLLGLWYVKRVDAALDVDVARPYVGALDTLLAGLPETQRTGTAAKLLTDLEGGYAEAGAPWPRWLQLLREDDRAVRL